MKIKYLKSFRTFLIAFLLTATVVSFAGNSKTIVAGSTDKTKIAVVDMEKIFKGYYKTQLNSAKLKKQAATYKEYADNLAESQLKLEEEFKSLRDASQNIALSETERESKRLAARDKYRQLQVKQTELQQYDQDKSAQLKEQYDKMRKSILIEIRKSIAKYAKEKGVIAVLDTSGKTMNDIPIIVYYQTDTDITDVILARLNKGAKKSE